MAKGYGGNPMGGANMNMIKQVQKMQKQVEQMQAELEKKTLEITSGGGAVKVVIDGKKQIQELTLSADIVDPNDIELLQDLLISAVNEAVRQVEELIQNQMSALTGGIGLPKGLF
ncbi:MAG: YbaB/EbfC family nucleoid-associated protein [Clostridiales bacterium]|jgi:DNA-binding YbaB/EbfC family protein|nr:YbaB/EbfC family nucleoid-associated protein [Clostridiales bacterium]